MKNEPNAPVAVVPAVDLAELIRRASRACEACNGAGVVFDDALAAQGTGADPLRPCRVAGCMEGRVLPGDLGAVVAELIGLRETVAVLTLRSALVDARAFGPGAAAPPPPDPREASIVAHLAKAERALARAVDELADYGDPAHCATDLHGVIELARNRNAAREGLRMLRDPSTRTWEHKCIACGAAAWVDSTGQRYFYCRTFLLAQDCRPAATTTTTEPAAR